MALKPNLHPEPWYITVPDEAGMLDWATVFGNPNPVELEIGSGKGTFLLNVAQAYPDRNYIGIEWAKPYADFAADRLRRHAQHNTRMVCAEATWWLRCHVPAGSLAGLHVYFPDPWPKTRHHKRRLVQLPFIQEAHRILRPGGTLRLVTDHADYFAWMQDVLARQDLLTVIPFTGVINPGDERGVVGTNFEKKYITEGRTFHATAAVKPAD